MDGLDAEERYDKTVREEGGTSTTLTCSTHTADKLLESVPEQKETRNRIKTTQCLA